MKRAIGLDEIKKIQLGILNEIDEYCKKNDIKYFLFAGTLLGAVRHKGYIPWDDDIDICMKRKEYKKFIEGYTGKTTSLLNNSRVHTYCYPFAKVVKQGTETTEHCKYAKKMGLYVDVFPVDNIPDNELEREKYFNEINKYKTLLSKKVYFKTFTLPRKLKYLFDFACTGFCSRAYCANKIDELASSYQDNSTQLCGNVMWGCQMKEAVNSSVFQDRCYAEFEGKEYPIPVGYDEWLSARYGDYMKLPPKEEQVGHDRVDYIIEDK